MCVSRMVRIPAGYPTQPHPLELLCKFLVQLSFPGLALESCAYRTPQFRSLIFFSLRQVTFSTILTRMYYDTMSFFESFLWQLVWDGWICCFSVFYVVYFLGERCKNNMKSLHSTHIFVQSPRNHWEMQGILTEISLGIGTTQHSIT